MNSVAVIEPVTDKDTLTCKPSLSIDAVALPSAICERFKPVIPLAGILYKPCPSPINEPVKYDAVTLSVR